MEAYMFKFYIDFVLDVFNYGLWALGFDKVYSIE
jgi:hypothetical protein